MKKSEIYLEAAKLIANPRRRDKYSCCAVSEVAELRAKMSPLKADQLADEYGKLFSAFPSDTGGSWLHRAFDQSQWCGDVYTKEMNQWRLTALCFASAIAKSEGR